MPRRRPNGGERATGRERAVVFGDAFRNVTQGLVCMQEALRLQGQEAMRRQEEAERRHQEAMRLQEQRAATALREAVGQMEAKLQEKDDAIRALEQRLEDTQQSVAVEGGRPVTSVEEGTLRRQDQDIHRILQEALCLQEQRAAAALHEAVGPMEAKLQEKEDAIRALEQRLKETQERVEVVEVKADGLVRSAEKEGLTRLEGRLQELEDSLQRTMQKFFPRVDGLLRQLEGTPPRKASSFPHLPSTSSGATCGEAATEGAAGGREDNPPPVESLAPSASSPAFPTPSSSSSSAASAPGASVSEAAGHQTERPHAGQGTQVEDERVQRQRTGLRIRRVMERVKAARAAPSPLREDLLEAVINGELQDVERLLDAGADVNCVDKNGRTPLLLAFLNARCEDMIELLLQRGADVNAVNIFGTSAMRQAACMDYSGRFVVRLVAAGGDVNARSETGATPLHCAANMRNVAAVRVLLAAGARKDLKPWKGFLKNKTPFEVAATPEIKELLRP